MVLNIPIPLSLSPSASMILSLFLHMCFLVIIFSPKRPIVLIFVSRPVCLYFPSIFFLYPINVFILLLKVYVCPRDRRVASFKFSSGTIFSHMMCSRPINEENSFDKRFCITTSRPRNYRRAPGGWTSLVVYAAQWPHLHVSSQPKGENSICILSCISGGWYWTFPFL